MDYSDDKHQFIQSLLDGMRGSQDSPAPLEHGDTGWMNETSTGIKPPVSQAQPKKDTGWLKNRNVVFPESVNPFVSEKQVGEKSAYEDLIEMYADLGPVEAAKKARDILQKLLEW